MTDEEKPPPPQPAEVKLHQSIYPHGHNFPDDILIQWVSIPYNEPVSIGPLTREAIDNLLFSMTDISGSIASLRSALVSYTNGDLETANRHIANSTSYLVDGETRNRLLFDAIVRSVIGVRNAGK
jgi:hypothetical protein